MPLDPPSSAIPGFVLQVERTFASLLDSSSPGPDPNLGGKLLYAGELDRDGCALAVAGNIAGAATLVATEELAGGKQALRDGVVDFLVTSLDEALRILKNEIRKQQTVAVCVAVAPSALEMEMQERGVRPDLMRFETHGRSENAAYLDWRVASAPARWLPKLDAMALQCLGRDSVAFIESARRWIRLAPRYLGRQTQSIRLARGTPEFYAAFVEQVRSAVKSGEMPVGVEIGFSGSGIDDRQFLSPQIP